MNDSTLYVARYAGGAQWRLLYAKPGAQFFTYAEGECSARYFRTMREAIAYGRRRYGEIARKWKGFGHEFE
jgi:hypothetical protein